MKKIISLIVLSSIAILGWSCSDGENDVSLPTITVLSADYEFTSYGGNGSLTVEPTGNLLLATSSDTWLTPTVSGYTVNYVVDDYKGIDSRTAKISLTSGGLTGEVSVTQIGATIKVDTESVYFDRDASQVVITVSPQNIPYEVTNQASWLTYTYEGDVYTFRADANTNMFPRLDTIYINFSREGTEHNLQVALTQEGTNSFDTYINSEWELTYVNGFYTDADKGGEADSVVTVTFTKDADANDDRYLVTGLKYPISLVYEHGLFHFLSSTRVGLLDEELEEDEEATNINQFLYDGTDQTLDLNGGAYLIPYATSSGDIRLELRADRNVEQTFTFTGFFFDDYDAYYSMRGRRTFAVNYPDFIML